MAKEMDIPEVESIDEVVQEPEKFKGKIEVDPKTGKKIIFIKTKKEVIKNADGTQDVIIHAPTLDLVNKFKEENS